MAAYRWVYDSRYLQLTARNRDQLLEPYTLSNRVWASFTFLSCFSAMSVECVVY